MFRSFVFKNLISAAGLWLAWQSVVCAQDSTPVAASVPQAMGEQRYRLRMTVGVDAPFGKSLFVLMLATTAEREPAVPITVYCEKGISVTPSSFVFGSAPQGSDAASKSVVVLRSSGGKSQIRSAVSSNPDLEIKVVAMKQGEIYLLRATYRGDFGRFEGSTIVTVETDAPQQPQLEIPVTNLRTSKNLRTGGN